MTEKEKALGGYLYRVDEDMRRDYEQAKALCYEFNQLHPSKHKEADELIKRLFGKTGKTISILPPLWVDYGSNIKVGEHFFANHNTVLLDVAEITFGDHVLIAPNCGFYTAAHPLDPELRMTDAEYALPITVGNRVWIGGNTVVMPGVTIGDDTVIGAGSVVTKDIPAGVLAFGNPCRVVRAITPGEKEKYRV